MLAVAEHLGFNAAWLLTRHIDWYGMGKKGAREKGAQQDPQRFRLWK